jgi:2-dehydro-3-deoxyphosphogluconate aldolase/(4S)-4-hydroxy-2-oxoglutarate aldolase
MTVGAGTITSVSEAQSAVSAGAEFLVSPHLDEDLVGWASVDGIPLIPGGFTPTEISRAWSLDVPAVKVFPVSVGGPNLIRGLLGPYPDLLLIPTGGVDAANAKDYLSAGAVAIGVGGWLTSHADMTAVVERASLLRRQVV